MAVAPSKPTLTVRGTDKTTLRLEAGMPNTGGANIQYWEYKLGSSISRMNSSNWLRCWGYVGNSLEFDLQNRTPGTTYYAKVRAVNEIGTSPESDMAKGATYSNSIPSTPKLKITASSTETIIGVLAEVDSDGGIPVDGWQYKFGRTAWPTQFDVDYESWNDIPQSSGSKIFYDITGLMPDEWYWVVVRAHNASGYSYDSESGDGEGIYKIAKVPKVVPTAPIVTLTPSLIDGEIAVAASCASDGASPITRWEIRFVRVVPGGADIFESAWEQVTGASGNSMTTTLTGLQEESEYEVEVRAQNAIGYSRESLTGLAEIGDLPGVPENPVLNVSAVAASNAIDISASTVDNNGSAITSWQYAAATTEAGLATATWYDIANSAGNSITARVSQGLAQSTSYYVIVRAVNAKGNSNPSPAAQVTTNNLPEVPLDITLTATAVYTDTQMTITLAGTADDDGSSITGWAHQISTTEAGIGTAPITAISGASGETLNATLAARTRADYWIRVRATNSIGNSDWSRIVMLPRVLAPAKPTLTAAADATDGHDTINLTANVTSNGGDPISEWQYKTATSAAGLGSAEWINTGEGGSDLTAFSVVNLAVNTTHHFQVRAYNGTSYSEASEAVSQATTAAEKPDKPTLSLSATEQAEINVSASLVSNNGAAVTQWEMRFATTTTLLASATWQTVSGETGNSMTTTITGLSGSTTYYVQVRATNSVGTSDVSATQNETTLRGDSAPQTPTGLGAVAGGTTLQIGGARVGDNGNNPITRWEYRLATSTSALNSASWSTANDIFGNALTGDNMGYTYIFGNSRNTTYYYQVRAVNAIGASQPVASSSVTTGGYLGPLLISYSVSDNTGPCSLVAISRGTGFTQWTIWASRPGVNTSYVAGQNLYSTNVINVSNASMQREGRNTRTSVQRVQVELRDWNQGIIGDNDYVSSVTYPFSKVVKSAPYFGTPSGDPEGAGAASDEGAVGLQTTAPSYRLEPGNQQVKINWESPADVRPTDWPWGAVVGYDQAFNASNSTNWKSEMMNLRSAKQGKATITYTLYKPDDIGTAVVEENVDVILLHGTSPDNLTQVTGAEHDLAAVQYLQAIISLRKTRNVGIKDATLTFTAAA